MKNNDIAKTGRRAAKIGTAVFIGAGIAMTAGSVWLTVECEKKIANWRPVEAQILGNRMRAEYRTTHSTSNGRRRTDRTRMYSAEYQFRYQWDGRPYERSYQDGFSTSNQASVERELERYKPGSRREVWVNPEDPSEIAVNLGRNFDTYFGPILLGCMGLIFVGVGFVVGRVALSSPRVQVRMQAFNTGRA
jgi:hypothetical protein